MKSRAAAPRFVLACSTLQHEAISKERKKPSDAGTRKTQRLGCPLVFAPTHRKTCESLRKCDRIQFSDLKLNYRN